MIKYYVDVNGSYLGSFDGATPPDGAIEVPAPPDHGDQIYVDGVFVDPVRTPEELEAMQDAEDAVAIKADATVKSLITATPAQIENYITTNVTDLTTAKDVLTILSKAISALGKREFR
jgi:hypothetical protein